ncbi:hypothetical protein BG011_006726 [Mortierella polycephala]|uniref:Uncharacterized protein n=1 Tax=Mortierella polycephala TaxID=41804 RepID=A0A9P6PRZ6_9FUNG|nr:hypothetical protein BG011_006726 [Mortierella polycephala]
MGWFSKSSVSSADVPQKQESIKEQAPSSNEGAPSATNIKHEPTSETTPPPAPEQSPEQGHGHTQAHEPEHSQTPVTRTNVMGFDEYDTSDDIYARFKVSDAMNELFACSSLGSNVRNYYRYGTFKDCAPRYDHLKFCLSIKTKSSQVAQVMIQKRDAELLSKKKGQPNSEDVWTTRTNPPEELLELSRQA